MRRFLGVLLSMCLLLEGVLPVCANTEAVELVGSGERYATLAEAVENAPADGVLKLLTDVQEDVTVDKTLYLDLNGKSVDGTLTVASDAVLYGMDCQTDDYTVEDGNGYGKIRQVAGQVAGVPEEADAAEDGYLMVKETEGVSFHRVNLQMIAMTLRTNNCGIYYKSAFSGDEVVAREVKTFGVALNAIGVPDESNMNATTKYSILTGFRPGADGNKDKTSTLLKNVIKPTNAALMNNTNANRPIYGRAYIETEDGYMFGATVSRSFRQQVEAVDTMWDSLGTTQKSLLTQMYMLFTKLMSSWNIPSIKAAAQQ